MRSFPSIPFSELPGNTPPVILGEFCDSPIVLGKEMPRLTWSQYRVVKALLAAGNDGLTKDRLDAESGHTDARKILKRLHDSDPNWAVVIVMPGIPGRRYRILCR
jgi:hypothetical protein